MQSLPERLRTRDVTVWVGPKVHAVLYPIRGGNVLNLVVIVHRQSPEPLEGWDHAANKRDLELAMGSAHSNLMDVLGAVQVIQGCLTALKASSNASIVLFSTVAVQTGMGFHASIASSKGAIEGLTRSLAAEWAPQIRVNAIAPSLVNTELAARLLSTPEKAEASARRHPLGRVGEASDPAALVRFLLSPEANWITGQVWGVDGGLGNLKVL